MPVFDRSVIPLGSTVLVTGVNGFVGSHVANQLLDYGYKVRGTVRDAQKHGWLSGIFEKKYGHGKFELFQVGNLTNEGVFDEAVKGMTAVAHVAAVVTMDPDVQTVIDTTVAGTISALESAAKEASVKRFVLTSSAGAVRDVEKHISENPVLVDEFNEDAVALARNIPESLTSLQKGYIAYVASKTISEQKAWEWVKENQPNFGFSTVVAPAILGRPLSVEKQGHPASSAMPVKLFEDNAAEFKYMSRFFYVSGEDVGLIHVAALVHPDVGNERIFAYAGPYSWNDWLKTFRELCPGKKFPDDAPGLDYAMSKIEGRQRAEGLLIDMGKPGFMGLEETVKANIEHLLV